MSIGDLKVETCLRHFPLREWSGVAGFVTARCLGLALACVLATSCAATALDAIVPEAKLQRVIAKVPAAKSAEELEAVLAELESSAGGDYDALVPQLVYFSMRGDDVRQAMTAGVVIDRLQISKEQLLRGIAPYLNTADPVLQRQLSNILSAIDKAPEPQPRDFSLFKPLLQQHREDPPVALVTHMLDSEPDAALDLLTATLLDDAETRNALLDAAKSTTEADFDQLVRNPAWWVRYYAVTHMRDKPEARTPERTRRLRNDTHPAVRAAAADLVR